MSTPHIEHFVDERGNFIYRAEFDGSFLSKDEAKELGKRVSGILDENAKLRELRELGWDLYCLAYPSAVEWEAYDAAYDKYNPCEKCHELHGGKSPCASTSKDMTEECCKPIQAAVVADRMRDLGVDA